MKIFHRVLVQFTIGILVLGMASIAVAAPISKRTPAMGLQGEGFGTIEPSGGIASKRSNRSSAVGCWNRPNQGTDLYVVALDESYVSECSPKMDGETAWMYAPGCANLKSSKNRLPSGHCSADDELVTNLGNLVVHSSDQMLGRVDVASHIYGAPKSLPAVASVDKEGDRALNAVKSSMRMDQALVATAFRFDRMGQEVFDGDEDNGASLILDFDHQLVMSGKLAHLVPKNGYGVRDVELGDLIILLLLALLPEKKRIRHLFRGLRSFQIS